MFKYMLGFALVFGLAVYVAIQDKRAAHQSAQEAQQPSKTTVSAIPDANHPQQNIPNTERNLPSWYGFFRWPNGTTTWAILLTLLAIAEQTHQTARAANATQRATELTEKNIILQFRPKLIVRKVFLRKGTNIPTIGVPDEHPWGVDYVIANIGGSRATLKRSGFEFTPFDSGTPARLSYKMQEPVEPVLIEPGEEKGFAVAIANNLINLFRILSTSGKDLSNQKIGSLYFWGCAQYADDTGIIRNVAVCRHYERETEKFTPSDDPDQEYAD